MITIRRSPSLSFNTEKHTSKSRSDLGLNSTRIRQKKFTSESTMSSIPVTGMGPNMGVSNNPITIDLDPILTGITPQVEAAYIYKLYRDIYYYDPVAGSAVDMMSSMPFSEYSLGGIADNKIAAKYMEALERLNMRTLPSEISIDYLVTGVHVSSLLYNKERRVFSDVMPHLIENIHIDELPFYSQDPIVTVKFPDSVKAVLAKDTSRIRRVKEYLGQPVVDKILQGELELDPLSTLYIARKTFSTTDIGTSYFKRILPIYLIEKNLIRGTLIESARRQRGILHITVGEADTWEPTVADLEFITDLFMGADSDPLGAIIATKMGVMTEELRQGGEFWRSTDFADSVLPHKLRALGISEAFLSGEANYSSSDTSMTFFIDMIKSYREMLTRKLFYNKLFPLISLLNGFTVNSKGKIVVKENLIDSIEDPEEALYMLNDGSRLLIPTLAWAKHLRSDVQDQGFYDMLNAMGEKGIPIPLRIMATAAGLNMDDIIKQQDDDIELRKKMLAYTKLLEQFKPPPEEGSEEAEASDYGPLLSEDPTLTTKSGVIANTGRIPLLSRDFGESGEIRDTSKTGKAKYVFNQRKANSKINSNIALAADKNKRRIATLKVSKEP